MRTSTVGGLRLRPLGAAFTTVGGTISKNRASSHPLHVAYGRAGCSLDSEVGPGVRVTTTTPRPDDYGLPRGGRAAAMADPHPAAASALSSATATWCA